MSHFPRSAIKILGGCVCVWRVSGLVYEMVPVTMHSLYTCVYVSDAFVALFY